MKDGDVGFIGGFIIIFVGILGLIIFLTSLLYIWWWFFTLSFVVGAFVSGFVGMLMVGLSLSLIDQ